MTLKPPFHSSYQFYSAAQLLHAHSEGLSLSRQSNQPVNMNQGKVSVCIITNKPLVVEQKIQLSGNLAVLSQVSGTP